MYNPAISRALADARTQVLIAESGAGRSRRSRWTRDPRRRRLTSVAAVLGVRPGVADAR
jgi:hypothetical protein